MLNPSSSGEGDEFGRGGSGGALDLVAIAGASDKRW